MTANSRKDNGGAAPHNDFLRREQNSAAKISRRRSVLALVTVLAAIGLLYFGAGLPLTEASLESENAHGQIDCSRCHKMQASIPRADGSGELNSALPSSNDCMQCHTVEQMGSNSFHNSGYGDCLSCHSFHHSEELTIAGRPASLSTAKASVELCADCHGESTTPEVSPGHRLAAQLIHGEQEGRFAEQPSEFCLLCHDRDASLPIAAPELSEFPRFHVQASHTYGTILVPGSGRPGSQLKIQREFPPEMPLFEGKIECQTCHSLVSGEKYLLTKRIEQGLCNDCHDMGDRTATNLLTTSR